MKRSPAPVTSRTPQQQPPAANAQTSGPSSTKHALRGMTFAEGAAALAPPGEGPPRRPGRTRDELSREVLANPVDGPPPSLPSSSAYDVAALRRLLLAITPDKVSEIAFLNFPRVYERLTPTMTAADMADHLLAHCLGTAQVDTLLEEAYKLAPHSFEVNAPYRYDGSDSGPTAAVPATFEPVTDHPLYFVDNLRKLALAAGRSEDLDTILFLDFDEVLEQLHPSVSYPQKVEALLSHCFERGRVDDLLEAFGERLPWLFEQHAPYYDSRGRQGHDAERTAGGLDTGGPTGAYAPPPPVVTHDPVYDVAAVRHLLEVGFGASELSTLLMIHFPRVYASTTSLQSMSLVRDALIAHCSRHDSFNILLEILAEENPRQFERCAPYYRLAEPERDRETTDDGPLSSTAAARRVAAGTLLPDDLMAVVWAFEQRAGVSLAPVFWPGVDAAGAVTAREDIPGATVNAKLRNVVRAVDGLGQLPLFLAVCAEENPAGYARLAAAVPSVDAHDANSEPAPGPVDEDALDALAATLRAGFAHDGLLDVAFDLDVRWDPPDAAKPQLIAAIVDHARALEGAGQRGVARLTAATPRHAPRASAPPTLNEAQLRELVQTWLGDHELRALAFDHLAFDRNDVPEGSREAFAVAVLSKARRDGALGDLERACALINPHGFEQVKRPLPAASGRVDIDGDPVAVERLEAFMVEVMSLEEVRAAAWDVGVDLEEVAPPSAPRGVSARALLARCAADGRLGELADAIAHARGEQLARHLGGEVTHVRTAPMTTAALPAGVLASRQARALVLSAMARGASGDTLRATEQIFAGGRDVLSTPGTARAERARRVVAHCVATGQDGALVAYLAEVNPGRFRPVLDALAPAATDRGRPA